MKEEIFSDYIILREKEKNIEEQLKEEYKRLEPLTELLYEVREKKSKIGNEILLKMNDSNIKTFQLGANNITRSVRETPKIVDHDKLAKFIFGPIAKTIKKLTGKTKEDLKKLVVTTISLKKEPTFEIIDTLIKVEGINIPGYEVQTTEYLTVK